LPRNLAEETSTRSFGKFHGMMGGERGFFLLLGVGALCLGLATGCKKKEKGDSEPTPKKPPTPTTGDPCEEDDNCDDGTFCNGVEVCQDGYCIEGRFPCAEAQSCRESAGVCVSDCDVDEDADGDGFLALECGGSDCDDSNPSRYPGNVEICDGLGWDEDCNPQTLGSRDADRDGYVDAACCNAELCGEDCDDGDSRVHPNEGEQCDGKDNDCDGEVDEDVPPALVPRWYPDEDGDGARRRAASGMQECATENPGYTLDSTEDCDDDDVERTPGTVELCDGKDNDCDPLTIGCLRSLSPGTTTIRGTVSIEEGVLNTETLECPKPLFLAAVDRTLVTYGPGLVTTVAEIRCQPLSVDEETGRVEKSLDTEYTVSMELTPSERIRVVAREEVVEEGAFCAQPFIFLDEICKVVNFVDGSLEKADDSAHCLPEELPVGIRFNAQSDEMSFICAEAEGAE
jgi:hypothetical protein